MLWDDSSHVTLSAPVWNYFSMQNCTRKEIEIATQKKTCFASIFGSRIDCDIGQFVDDGQEDGKKSKGK